MTRSGRDRTYLLLSAGALLLLSNDPALAEPASCTYTTYKWNVAQRKAVERKRVRHPYSQVAPFERDSLTGCTVCEEDQVVVRLPGLPPVRMCHAVAERVAPALTGLIEQGEPIFRIVAYRVGMTRGDTDAAGNRTRFSNHSFGIALDINDDRNGLYDHCIQYGPRCRLIKGGAWTPGKAGSWTGNSAVVQALEQVGLRWGGQIAGRQKDFMHFSPTGY